MSGQLRALVYNFECQLEPTPVCGRLEADRTLLRMLPDLQLNDLLRLRKPHPCGSYEWTVVRLGADIGLECKGCGHRVMLTRRELAKRMKTNLTRRDEQQPPRS
jgi:hypothetical protein